MTPEPVRFQRVDEDGGSEPDTVEAKDAAPAEPSELGEVHEAERDPYPLAGPILNQARARVLRGECSSCEARLRLRLGPEQAGSLAVRCPICGHTREIEA